MNYRLATEGFRALANRRTEFEDSHLDPEDYMVLEAIKSSPKNQSGLVSKEGILSHISDAFDYPEEIEHYLDWLHNHEYITDMTGVVVGGSLSSIDRLESRTERRYQTFIDHAVRDTVEGKMGSGKYDYAVIGAKAIEKYGITPYEAAYAIWNDLTDYGRSPDYIFDNMTELIRIIEEAYNA